MTAIVPGRCNLRCARMRKILLAFAFACGAAAGADEPEAVYRRMHAAALAGNLDEMRLYAAEAERATLIVPNVPKTYRLTGKGARRDGLAIELRASAIGDSVGLGYTQIFGVIDLVREGGEWKVARLSWSTERPGEYPEGFVVVQGAAPEPRSSAEPQVPRFRLPPSAPERSRLFNPKRAQEAAPDTPAPATERPPPCEIKPVMTDDELRACGAHIP